MPLFKNHIVTIVFTAFISSIILTGCRNKSAVCPKNETGHAGMSAGSGLKKRDKNGHIVKKKPKKLSKK